MGEERHEGVGAGIARNPRALLDPKMQSGKYYRKYFSPAPILMAVDSSLITPEAV